MTTPIGQFVDTTTGRTSTNPFITIIKNRAPTGNDGINNSLQVGQRWIDSAASNQEYFLLDFIASQGIVQANWVELGGSNGVESLTGNSGGAVPPTSSGNINVVGDGTTGGLFVGSPSTDTLTLTLNAIPNSALANDAISLVAGTGISISTSPVVLGGTTTISATNAGDTTSLTGNSGGAVSPTSGNINVVGDGTTISIVGNPSTHTLTASYIGSGAFVSVNVQTFTSSGTYTPTSKMIYCMVEVVGGGGGGGSAFSTTSNQFLTSSGGGGGGYSRGLFSAATIGASQSVTIGTAGTGGSSAGFNNGGTGGTTSVGALISATGGTGGGATGTGLIINFVGAGGSGSGGNFSTVGSPGSFGASTPAAGSISGNGGSSFFGGGAAGVFTATSSASNGGVALSYGGGGSGAVSAAATATSASGGNGFAGIVVITEFIG
jgi:hypothetical protein